MFYRALGYAVWQGIKWYVGRKTPTQAGRRGPSARTLAALGVGAAVATAIAVGAKRNASSS
jgi:hypothetical protein